MTRIDFVVTNDYLATYTIDDPRSMRDLVKLINTGEMTVGEGEVRMGDEPQWATAIKHLNIVVVMFQPREVDLAPRHYDVLFGIADGLNANQIAQALGIARRTVYEYTADLKERFEVKSKEEIIAQAVKMGLI